MSECLKMCVVACPGGLSGFGVGEKSSNSCGVQRLEVAMAMIGSRPLHMSCCIANPGLSGPRLAGRQAEEGPEGGGLRGPRRATQFLACQPIDAIPATLNHDDCVRASSAPVSSIYFATVDT